MKKSAQHCITGLMMIIGIFIITGCSGSENADYIDMSAKEAFELSQQPDVLLLDVRTAAEHSRAKIKGSVLIPVQVMQQEFIKIKDHKNSKILIYCHSGNRSVTASKWLINNGFKNIYNLKDGIIDWARHKYPIEYSK